MNRHPRIGLIVAGSSDVRLVKSCRETLEAFGEPYEMVIASPQRSPDRARRWAEGAEGRGLRVIIAAMGGSAALPGLVAAHTTLPVVGLPLDLTHLRGVDSLYSMLQTPVGYPVGAVGINGGENAALLALQIVATSDEALGRRLAAHREELARQGERMCEDLYAERPDLRPDAANASSPRPGEPQPQPERDGAEARLLERRDSQPDSPASKAEPAPIKTRRIAVDPSQPNPDVLELAADTLLMGGIVALPTDTVYGLAADATQPKSVQRLFALKGRADDRAIPLLIHTRRLLSLIASETPQEVEPALDRFWPGGLTVVFKKLAGTFSSSAPGGTVGVRIPNHPVTLGVISKTGRPLAVTSANPSGAEPSLDAGSVAAAFNGQVDLILDAGPCGANSASTVLHVAERPFRILREGAVSRDELAEILEELRN